MLLLTLPNQLSRVPIVTAAAAASAGAGAGATTIDLTTVYTPISKTTASASARTGKTKLLKQPPPAPPTPLASATLHDKTTLQHQALTAANADASANLVAGPSKSYVSEPTTDTPKLLKRSGQTAELKLKKPVKGLRNRTLEIERSSKLQVEVVSIGNL